MPDLSFHENSEKPRPKPKNLVVALLPSWSRKRAQAILNKSDGESARLLHRVIAREQVRIRIQAAVFVMSASLLLIKLAPISQPPWYISALVSLGLTLLVSSTFTGYLSRLETAALETLSQGEDVAYIGPLLEALQKRYENEPLRDKIKQALVRLLPQCTQDVFDLLTPLQRRSLYAILNDDLRPSNVKLHLEALNLLGRLGDQSCLGIVYRQATWATASPLVQIAARDSVEQMCRLLNFGSLHRIPEYTDKLLPQLRLTGVNYQVCGACIMALRQLMPQLTPDNYKNILSDGQRDRLYQLLTAQSLYGNYRYGKEELFQEIIAAAGRLRDIRAIRFLQIIAWNETPTVGAKQLRAAARETLHLLEAEVEKEKESRTLLRGASAPASQAEQLLRAATPVESVTMPDELLRAAPPLQKRANSHRPTGRDEGNALCIQGRIDTNP